MDLVLYLLHSFLVKVTCQLYFCLGEEDDVEEDRAAAFKWRSMRLFDGHGGSASFLRQFHCPKTDLIHSIRIEKHDTYCL